MKNRNLAESIKYAAEGIVQGFGTERNLKTYCVIAVTFLLFNVLLSVGKYEYVIFVMLAAAVFSLEFVNTSIERVVDRFGDGIDQDCKFIKDVAAGAVLVSGFAFFAVEGILLISRLLEVLAL